LLGFNHSADTIAKLSKSKTEEQKTKFSATRGTSMFMIFMAHLEIVLVQGEKQQNILNAQSLLL